MASPFMTGPLAPVGILNLIRASLGIPPDSTFPENALAGPAREGLCLLQGLLLCGICGRRLTVRYTGNGGLYPIYECNWRTRAGLPLRHCMSLPAGPLDDAIAERV